MKALSDPSRVRVLKLLEYGELCACEIQDLLGLAQSTVSKHMKLLEDADLVEGRRKGTWTIYSLADGADSLYAKTMLAQLRCWLETDRELELMRTRLPDVASVRANCSG